MKEPQETISTWANDTFGPSGSNVRVAARANEEMAELLRALSADDASPKAAEEVADVFIVLYRLAWRLGVDIHEEVDRKMAINRAREWKLDATGHGLPREVQAVRSLHAFTGKGKCAGSTAYVLGETESEARGRLTRNDSCTFFDIAEALPLLSSVPSGGGESA